MKFAALKEVTGGWLRDSCAWLVKEQMGCCSICFASDSKYNYVVCVGWHDLGDGPKEDNYHHWVVAWKIGRQTLDNVMQCDFDVDFDLPYNGETGDVDDTLEEIEVDGRKPVGYKSWSALASHIRKEARRVWRDWGEE